MKNGLFDIHKVIISRNEINNEIGEGYSDYDLTQYMFSRTALKANKLGKENKKVVKFKWKYDNAIDMYELIFACEKNDWY